MPHYWNNEEFTKALADEDTNKIGEMLLLLSSSVAATWGAQNDKEELASAVVLKLFETIPKYEPERGNPFSYFTTVARNELCALIRKNITKYHNDIKYWRHSIYLHGELDNYTDPAEDDSFRIDVNNRKRDKHREDKCRQGSCLPARAKPQTRAKGKTNKGKK